MPYGALLTQTATYWAPSTKDGFGGLSFASPTTIDVRWEDKVELLQDDDGEEVMSYAIVYTNQELADNGYLYLGTSLAADPLAVNNTFRILQREKSQTPNGAVIVYKNIMGEA